MNKIIIILLSMLFSMSLCYAKGSQAPQHSNELNGFYFGIHTGLEMGLYRNNTISHADLRGNDTASVPNNYINDRTSAITGFSFGAARSWQKFYLSIAGLVNFGQRVYTGNTTYTQTATPNIRFENEVTAKTIGLNFEALLMPGFMIHPKTAVFGIVGLSRTRFRLDSQTDYHAQSNRNIDIGNLHHGREQVKVGQAIGAGIRTQARPKLNVTLMYLYKSFGRIHSEGSSKILGAQMADTLSNRSEIKPKSQAILLGIDYTPNG